MSAIGGFVFKHESRDWRGLVDDILELWDRHHPDDPFVVLVVATLEHFGLTGQRVLPAPSDVWTRSVLGLSRLVLAENAGEAGRNTELLDATIAGYRACGDGWGLATALGVKGMLEAYDGELDRAAASWSEALPLLEALGAAEDAALARLRILSLRLATADEAELADLRRTLAVNLDAAVRDGDRTAQALARLGLGHVERVAGDDRASVLHVRALLQQLDAVEPFGGGQLESVARASLAAALAASGEVDEARAELAAGADLAHATRDMPVLAYVAVMAAAVAHQTGNDAEAARLLGAAVAIRGREDLSNRDAQALAALLRESLGADRYAAVYAAGAGLGREAAVEYACEAVRT
jgi:hypothetical protein